MKLEKMIIENFKGIKRLEVKAGKNIVISGKNGSGKSTVLDAVNWLLFGKNIEDSTKFAVTPLNEEGVKQTNVETSVTGWFDINGRETKIKRTLSEKYSKTKESAEKILSGYTTSFEVDDENCSRSDKGEIREKDFQAYIESICPEKIFRLIIDGDFFLNDNKMSWAERRTILADLAGIDLKVLKNLEVSKTMAQALAKEAQALAEKKSEQIIGMKNSLSGKNNLKELEEKRAKLSAEKTLFLKEISRIENDELTAEKRTKIEKLKTDLARSEKIALNSKANDKDIIKAKISNINKLIEVERRTESNLREMLSGKENLIKLKREEKDKIKLHIAEAQEAKFEGVVICPMTKKSCACADVVENAETMFNRRKAETEEALNNDLSLTINAGKQLKAEIEKLVADLEKKQDDILKLAKERSELESLVSSEEESENPEKTIIVDKIIAIEKEIAIISENKKGVIAEYKEKIEKVVQEEELLLQEIATIKADERVLKIIEDAESEQRKHADVVVVKTKEVAELEKAIRKTAVEISNKVNSAFKIVSFKMFEENISNQGIKDCCIPLVNGVPYSDANTASKINAAIDVSNVISSHFNKSLFSLIDNTEAVGELVESCNQLICCRHVAGAEFKIETF